MLYAALRPVVGVALHWYYRSLTVANGDRIPGHGPLFLAANHPNALTDAMVLGWVAPRRVRYTAKATLFTNRAAAALLRAVGVIPLRRAADERPTPDDGTPERPSAVPDVARNAAAFDAVADALAEAACVAIFPEGVTRDAPTLQPIRTGLARMALHARTARGVRDIRIVPIGLLFERKEEPRSRVLVQVGEPIAVDDIPDGPTAVATLTALVEARLRAVTLNFDRAEDAERITQLSATLAALLEPAGPLAQGPPPLAHTIALARRIARAQEALAREDDPAVADRLATFERRLRDFHDRLRAERLDVHDLRIDLSVRRGAGFVLREALWASLLVPLGGWGRLTHWLPLRLTRALALRNVRTRDEPAMRTFVLGLGLVLATYACTAALVAAAAGPWWALGYVASLVPSATIDFRYGDRVARVRARARAYRRFRRAPAVRDALVADADWLMAEAGALERLAAAV